MKYLIAILSLLSISVSAQPNFNLTIEEATLPNAPGVQSFVVGQHNGMWLVIGGRKDGLHQRQPFASFLAADNNVTAYVIDPVNLQHWSVSLSSLPTALYEQLQSTNMEFIQRDTVLYIIGGYGYSTTAGDHITYDQLVAVNIPTVMNRVINGETISDQFRYTSNSNMAVTGGYLGLLDDTFYLVGGQYFEGRYNPMGPTHGPGFIQQYTEAIRKFTITDDGTSLTIGNYNETTDTDNLHRRDYNMVAQVFPNGDEGFTAFSGVFQHTVDLPWHNTVDVTASGYTVNNNFDQLLSQYHSANLPIYDQAANEMLTLFFGGMSRYRYDTTTGNLIDDDAVPFVKTISLVTRHSDGTMEESQLELQMPGFLGSGAEFIPVESISFLNDEILELNTLAMNQPTLVGYIYGGIESSAENIFFINDGSQSWASGRLFKVFITRTEATGVEGTLMTADEALHVVTYPNPTSDVLTIGLRTAYRTKATLEVLDSTGRLMLSEDLDLQQEKTRNLVYDCSDWSAGNYSVRFSSGAFSKTTTFVVTK